MAARAAAAGALYHALPAAPGNLRTVRHPTPGEEPGAALHMKMKPGPGAHGQVRLRYLGHSAFLWTSPRGMRVLVDPFQDPDDGPAWFQAPFPRGRADLVASTHDHFDHNAVALVDGSPARLIGPGRYSAPGISVAGIAEEHAGRWQMPNALMVVESGGVRFCHCGDNRWNPAPEAVAAAGRVDVVMVPVDDSRHLLSFPEVWELATAFSPRVIVPMHYLAEGVTAASSALSTIEEWLSSLPRGVRVRREQGPEAAIEPGDLPSGSAPEVWVFEPDTIA